MTSPKLFNTEKGHFKMSKRCYFSHYLQSYKILRMYTGTQSKNLIILNIIKIIMFDHCSETNYGTVVEEL